MATRNATSGLIAVYVNGVQEDTEIGKTGALNGVSELRIGQIQTSGRNFEGMLDVKVCGEEAAKFALHVDTNRV